MTFNYKGDEQPPTTNVHNRSLDYLLVIEQPLVRILGLEITTFKKGNYYSKRNRDPLEFSQLADETRFKFKLVKYNQQEVWLEEPIDHSAESLSWLFTEAFEENNIPIKVSISDDHKWFKVNISDNDYQVQFSNTVNKYLGLPVNHIFRETSEIIISDSIREEPFNIIDKSQNAKLPVTQNKVLKQPIMTHFLLCCDLTELQVYNSTFFPILKVVPLANISSKEYVETHLVFNPINYLPLAKNEFKSIFVLLIDTTGQTLKASPYSTTIILHFKNKYT